MKQIAIPMWLATIAIAVMGPAGATGCAAADSAMDAGAGDAGSEPDAGPQVRAPEVYGTERTLSPLTPYIADHLRAITARGAELQGNVFAKVGDGATVSTSFVHCLDSGYVSPMPGEESGEIDLAGRDELKSAIAFFRDGNAAGTTPYRRTSVAARVGASSATVLAGSPSPLEREYQALAPGFALVMLGTVDAELGDIDAYGSNLLDIADRSMAAGVIPIFSSLMPRDDNSALAAEVQRYNAIVRGVAQARQVPFIDLFRAAAGLPDLGMGADGTLPSVYRDGDGVARPCVFDDTGLGYGYNLRNLLTLQTLDRMLGAVIDGGEAPDASTRTITGTGTADDPVIIDELPFAHVGDTSTASSRNVDRYDGCQASQNESGPELIYRLEVGQSTRIRAMIIDRGPTDIDIHLLQGGSSGDMCLQRAHQSFTAELEPGTYYFNVDTFVSADGVERVGEYLFVVMEEP